MKIVASVCVCVSIKTRRVMFRVSSLSLGFPGFFSNLDNKMRRASLIDLIAQRTEKNANDVRN